MTARQFIEQYRDKHSFSLEDIKQFSKDEELGKGLVMYLRSEPDRDFSIALLKRLMELRGGEEVEIDMYNIMLGCFLVGLHQQVEDSQLIWEAKYLDFDLYCAVDIQLVVFAGVKVTIDYLSKAGSEDALKYVMSCNEAGDFDDLEVYFAKDGLPWWLQDYENP